MSRRQGRKEGRDHRDEGAERARRAVDPVWKTKAQAVLDALIRERRPFTTDDIWEVAGEPMFGDPRALGAMILAARRLNRIAPTGRHVQSSRSICHVRPVKEWIGSGELPPRSRLRPAPLLPFDDRGDMQ